MKNKFLITLSLLTFFSSIALCKDIKEEKEIILKLEPQLTYDENQKYEEAKEYTQEKTKSKSNLDLGVDVDINKEEKTIDKLKLDMGTKF